MFSVSDTPENYLILEDVPTEYRLSVTEPDGGCVWSGHSNVEMAELDDEMAYIVSALYASVLEDCIIKFRILEQCNNQLRVIKAQVDFGLLIANKYGVATRADADELSGSDAKNQDTYIVNKLDKDRKFILTVLTETYRNLSMNRSFNNLFCVIEDIIAQHTYRQALEQEEAKNKQLRRELIRQLRQQRNHNMAANYETDGIIEQLRSKVEDNNLVAETRSRYIAKWQIARTEQHQLQIKRKESVPADDIEFVKQQIEREQRVHAEIETIVSLITNETLSKIDQWMDKFDKDMEAIDLKIQIMKTKFNNANDRRIMLEKTYEQHIKLMASWKEFKDQREKQRLYRLKMNQSAIIVQAWWRGIQVRFELGPYKVKKRRGGGGGKKKK